jgi:hypothetical protein
MSASQVIAAIKPLRAVLELELAIPDYQRPYRWEESHVQQLLEDIRDSWQAEKTSYRIGSLILNPQREPEKVWNIVDGQQRITTLLLVLKQLGSDSGNDLRKSLRYRHRDSHVALVRNDAFIRHWLTENISGKEGFLTYLLTACAFVEIQVADLSEAFQLFDTQNGRGKELEAYNLLKAYHIRAMETDSFDEKKICDQNWEKATLYKPAGSPDFRDLLRQVINEQLYRSRVWSRKDEAGRFSKKAIGEFKGTTLGRTQLSRHPYQNRDLMRQVLQSYLQSQGLAIAGMQSRFRNSNPANVNPLASMNQAILNGKDFFGYVETYVEIYKRLFVEGPGHEDFRNFIAMYCTGYSGAQRDGDRYLFELYKSAVMLLFDRFGEDGLERYYKLLYLLIYRMRLEKKAVKYSAVSDEAVRNKIFHTLEHARSLADLQILFQKAFVKVEVNKSVKDIEGLFIENKVELIIQP